MSIPLADGGVLSPDCPGRCLNHVPDSRNDVGRRALWAASLCPSNQVPVSPTPSVCDASRGRYEEVGDGIR